MKKSFTKFMLFFSALLVAGCAGTPPGNLGINDGRLADCPGRPNCASSQAADANPTVEPIAYTENRKAALQTLVRVLETWPGTTIVKRTDSYVYVECRSEIFGFVDDVEFYFPDKKAVIHVRSASRLGYSDLGVNQKRIEAIRKAFLDGTRK